ncbi:response regulator transcription factor [Streptomyces sp. NPDC050523]|uniref:response regulator transcription factor n=1 Tax=Streptomyces sp. NPDC050523 TaxID=3365622 RepID=UPI00378A0DC1
MRILVVEDEAPMAELVRRCLREDSFAVDVAATGEEGLWYAGETDYDAIVLDVMLPGTDGFGVLREIRANDGWAPVLLLTARDAIEDRVRGLDLGADDYLVKPFALAELLSRLRALMRRGARERPAVFTVGDLTLDPATRSVARGATPITLTAKEFALLEYLMRRPGQVLSKAELIAHVWDFTFDADSNVVEVYVGYLRQKIDRPFARQSLRTSRGAGYCLKDDRKAPVDHAHPVG